MPEHNEYFDTVIAESYRTLDSDQPEPLDNWTLEDFEDLLEVDAR